MQHGELKQLHEEPNVRSQTEVNLNIHYVNGKQKVIKKRRRRRAVIFKVQFNLLMMDGLCYITSANILCACSTCLNLKQINISNISGSFLDLILCSSNVLVCRATENLSSVIDPTLHLKFNFRLTLIIPL